MADRTYASPADLPAAPGYSHAVGVPAGRQVFTAGQVAMDVDGNVVATDWEGQTRAALANVGRALQAAGATWADVVKLTWFVTDVTQLAAIRTVRDEFVDTARPPASSLVQVAALFRPDLLVEVEAIAVVG